MSMVSFESDTVWMEGALQLAKKAGDAGEVPIGALVLSPTGRVVGHGYNRTESLKSQDQHAEMEAIRQACATLDDWRLDGCTIYVTLEPCMMCVGCIALSRIERLVYAAASPRYGFCKDDELLYGLYDKQLKNITAGVCKEASENLLKDFFARRRA